MRGSIASKINVMDFLNPLSNEDEEEEDEQPHYEHYVNYFHEQIDIQKGRTLNSSRVEPRVNLFSPKNMTEGRISVFSPTNSIKSAANTNFWSTISEEDLPDDL